MRGFRQFSAHLTKCHACHGICTLSPLDAALTMRFAKTRNTTRLKCFACQAKWPWTRPKCCACHENCNARKSIAPATQNDFRHVTKHVWISRSATPATRNEATRHVQPPKVFCRTYHRHGHTGLARTVANGCERLWTVANGCERLRAVANINATSTEHTLNPQTPRVKREPLLRIREKLPRDQEDTPLRS